MCEWLCFPYREVEAHINMQMQRIDFLCDMLEAALQKLPYWLSHSDLAPSSAASRNSLSQVPHTLYCTFFYAVQFFKKVVAEVARRYGCLLWLLC